MTINNEVSNIEISNIASIPFVAMALQTQEEINAGYMRKMNRDYATYIRNPETTSLRTIELPQNVSSGNSPSNAKRNEQESS